MKATKRRAMREPQPIEISSETTGSSMAIEVVTRTMRSAGFAGRLEHGAHVARRDRIVAGDDLGADAVARRGIVGVEQDAGAEVEVLAERRLVAAGSEAQRRRHGRDQEKRDADGKGKRKSRHRGVFRSERL